MKYRLILPPSAIIENVAQSVRQEINALNNIEPGRGAIMKFNPATRKLERIYP